MKIVIDEDVVKSSELTLSELFAVLLVKTGIDISSLFQDLEKKEILVKDMFNNYLITSRWNDVVSEILLNSEKIKPEEDRLTSLASNLMKIFDKGKKDGKYYFKGNKREITLKLKKFFKLYGDKYSEDDIIKAATKYVQSFNGNYTYMRLLKYFICKDEKKTDSEGLGYIEEVSELATYLDNLDEEYTNSDWTSTLK